jgi:hypothetical protein
VAKTYYVVIIRLSIIWTFFVITFCYHRIYWQLSFPVWPYFYTSDMVLYPANIISHF